jgi:hypothetical protein
MQNSVKDFWIWLTWLAVTVCTVLGGLRFWYIANQDAIAQNDYRDKTGVTWIILIVFLVALVINMANTWLIAQEFTHLNRTQGLFYEHVKNLKLAAQSQLVIDQDFSLSIIENRLLRRESWVQLFGGLLITLGMVGTVLGLTLAMGALSGSLDSIQSSLSPDGGVSNSDSVAGLGAALAGMSSAFITTLAGAVLGGLFLKLLSHSTTNLIEDLLDRMRYKAELEVIPELQREAWNREMHNLSQAHQTLQTFISSAGTIEQVLHQYTQSMGGAASNLEAIAHQIDQQLLTYTDATRQSLVFERMDRSLGTLGTTMKALDGAIARLTLAVVAIAVVFGLVLWVGR